MNISASNQNQKSPSQTKIRELKTNLRLAPSQISVDELCSDFMEQVAQNISEENQRYLFQQARKIAEHVNQTKLEPFAAALVLNKALVRLRTATTKPSPQAAKIQKLVKSAKAYLKVLYAAEEQLSNPTL